MLNLRFTAKFKRDYRRVKSQGKNLAKLEMILEALQRREDLPEARATIPWAERIEDIANAISNPIGSSFIVSTRRGSSLLPHAREATASCWGYERRQRSYRDLVMPYRHRT